jgi:hypothetical protein
MLRVLGKGILTSWGALLDGLSGAHHRLKLPDFTGKERDFFLTDDLKNAGSVGGVFGVFNACGLAKEIRDTGRPAKVKIQPYAKNL